MSPGFGGGDTSFSRALLTAAELPTAPVVVVELCLGITVVV